MPATGRANTNSTKVTELRVSVPESAYRRTGNVVPCVLDTKPWRQPNGRVPFEQGLSSQAAAGGRSTMAVEVKNIRTRLTWHDGVATFFAGMIALVTLAGVNERGWPLLGSYTSSSLVILLLAVPMCAVGGNAFWNSVAFEHPIRAFRDPYLAIDMVLALVALTVVITALVTGTQQWFLALAAVIGVKWAVATTRHAVESEARLGRYHLVLTH